MASGLERLSSVLDRLCRWGAIATMVLMVVLIGVQVVARYVWAAPPGWTEEGARYAMVWSGLLGATVAFRARFDPVLTRLAFFEHGPMRTVAGALRLVATLLFLGPIWFFSVFGPGFDLSRGYIARSAARSAEAVGLSMAWFTAALPVAITVIFIHLLADVVGRWPAGARR